jgi:hypothetical protein
LVEKAEVEKAEAHEGPIVVKAKLCWTIVSLAERQYSAPMVLMATKEAFGHPKDHKDQKE